MDSLPKGIGDGENILPIVFLAILSDMDSLPKGIGDQIQPSVVQTGVVDVRHGLTAERHW